MRAFYQLTFLVAALFASATGFAQLGSVTGTVYDSDGTSTLPGANIYLTNNLSIGTVSDVDGTFLLSGVPVGTQSVTISFAGFDKQVLDVEVIDGTPANLEVTLGSTAITGETVIVTAQALGQAKAINQQLSSDAIANFVSADKIKELPDVNAAEAISRLPGVAINRSGGEGSKVVVRGLDPKFTAISINGVRLPATSGTDRSVDLALISPELLSGIELFKNPTPDMDGDALGGSINLNIIKAPKQKKASLKALGGYNGLAETYSDYQFTGSYSQRVLGDRLGISINANVERFNRSAEVINMSWRGDDKTVIDSSRNIFELEGNGLSYRRTEEERTRQNGSLGIDFAWGPRSESTILGIFSRTARDRFSQQEGYNGGINYRPNITENSTRLFSGSISTRHAFDAFSVEWGLAHSDILGETPLDFDVQVFSLNGAFTTEVDEGTNRRRPENWDRFVAPALNSDYLQRAYIVESSNTEGITTGYFDISAPFSLGEKVSATFKTGAKARVASRTRTYNEFTNIFGLYLTPNEFFSEFGTIAAVGAADPSFYYSADNFAAPVGTSTPFTRVDGAETQLFRTFEKGRMLRFKELYENTDIFAKNRFQEVNNYTLDENVYSGYAMLKLKVGKKLTAIPGVRIEQSDNTYTGIYADLQNELGQAGDLIEENVDVDYTNILPHLHLKYQFTDWLDLRASYSNTLARPDFDYIVPFTLVNRSGDLAVRQGNPNLNASQSENLDFYLTAYQGSIGLFSVGAFRKNISDAFYPFLIGLNDSSLVAEYGFPQEGFGNALLTTYTSSPESTVEGVEFDLQSNLNFLPGALSGLILSFNYSILRSETTINGTRDSIFFTGTPRRPIPNLVVLPEQRVVDLVGQARSILNLSIGYDFKGLSTRVSAAYQGSKIFRYSSSQDTDQFNAGFWRFDAAVKYRFSRSFNVFLNLNNLSDQQDINFQRDERFTTSISTFGATARLGAQYNFFKREARE